jgi:hypothetical protein
MHGVGGVLKPAGSNRTHPNLEERVDRANGSAVLCSPKRGLHETCEPVPDPICFCRVELPKGHKDPNPWNLESQYSTTWLSDPAAVALRRREQGHANSTSSNRQVGVRGMITV